MQRVANGALALLVVAALVGCWAPAAAQTAKPAPAVPDLSGRWLLDRRLSDDARQKIREAEQRRGQRQAGRRLPLLPLTPDEAPSDTMDALLDPADELSVEQSSTAIVLDETFARRRALRTDGRRRKADNGTGEVAAAWREGRLVVETKAARGLTTRETWELSASGARLTCTTQLDAGGGVVVLVARAYERARAERR